MNRKKAAQFLREGRRAEARECLQRSIDISPEMALELMNVSTLIYEPQHDKTNKVTGHPAKTQISLGIRPV